MVVVAITGVMAGLSASALEPMVRRIRVSSGADAVADALAWGRVQARSANRCVRIEVIPWESGSPATTLRANGTEPGNALRIYRWGDADCETATAADYRGIDYLDTFFLPSGSVVSFKNAADNPAVWRGNGRLLGNVDVQWVVTSDADPAVTSSVIVEPNGAICSSLGPGGGTCP
jgi:hypothetical protein